jgi:hypothetical protein
VEAVTANPPVPYNHVKHTEQRATYEPLGACIRTNPPLPGNGWYRARGAHPNPSEFAGDSPLEEAGFEPSVPGKPQGVVGSRSPRLFRWRGIK